MMGDSFQLLEKADGHLILPLSTIVWPPNP